MTATSLADARDRPSYTFREAAHDLLLPPSTVRLWALGQRYATTLHGPKLAPPLFRVAQKAPPTLSFWNLVEVYVIATIRRRYGVSLQKVRRALAFVQERLDVDRPLIQEEFLTNGVDLFVERYSQLIEVSEQGQLAMLELLRGSLKRIERDPEGLALRLWPWIKSPDEDRFVEIDPHRAFGRLVIAGTRIPTEVVAQRFRAGDTIAHLASDYRIEPTQVESALRWEQCLAAA